jgi:hypothetical protein
VRLERVAPADTDGRVAWLYRELFGREASPGELARSRAFFNSAAENDSTAELWREYCQVLLGSNELLFVE